MRVAKCSRQAKFGGDCSANLVEIWRQAGMGSSARTKGKISGRRMEFVEEDFMRENDEFVGWGGEGRDSHAERFRVGTH